MLLVLVNVSEDDELRQGLFSILRVILGDEESYGKVQPQQHVRYYLQ